MDNYIMFEGIKLPLTDEQIKKLKLEDELRKEPFQRVESGHIFYYINRIGEIDTCSESYNRTNNEFYDVGNYCKDKRMLGQRALHETLNRLLWRYSVENGEADNPWDCNNQHFYICFDEMKRAFGVRDNWCLHSLCEVYFPTEEVANKAITDVVTPFLAEHKDFVW